MFRALPSPGTWASRPPPLRRSGEARRAIHVPDAMHGSGNGLRSIYAVGCCAPFLRSTTTCRFRSCSCFVPSATTGAGPSTGCSRSGSSRVKLVLIVVVVLPVVVRVSRVVKSDLPRARERRAAGREARPLEAHPKLEALPRVGSPSARRHAAGWTSGVTSTARQPRNSPSTSAADNAQLQLGNRAERLSRARCVAVGSTGLGHAGSSPQFLAHEYGATSRTATPAGGRVFALAVRRSPRLHDDLAGSRAAVAASWFNPAWIFGRGASHRVFPAASSQGRVAPFKEVLADRWGRPSGGTGPTTFERGLTHVVGAKHSLQGRPRERDAQRGSSRRASPLFESSIGTSPDHVAVPRTDLDAGHRRKRSPRTPKRSTTAIRLPKQGASSGVRRDRARPRLWCRTSERGPAAAWSLLLFRRPRRARRGEMNRFAVPQQPASRTPAFARS